MRPILRAMQQVEQFLIVDALEIPRGVCFRRVLHNYVSAGSNIRLRECTIKTVKTEGLYRLNDMVDVLRREWEEVE